MKIKTIVLLALPIFLLTLTVSNFIVYATEERRVLSRKYLGLGVDVYAPYKAYPGETITVRVRVEALEDVKNASVTLFIWGSKSEGYSPWGTSFTVLDVSDFLNGAIKEEGYDIAIPSDVSPGLTYGILSLEWGIYGSSSWKQQWDKASFRVTYLRNKDYEDLQTTLQNTRTLMYSFLATTITLAILTTYFAKKKPRAKRIRK